MFTKYFIVQEVSGTSQNVHFVSKMAWYYTLLIQDNNLEMLMAQTHIVPANPRACKRCLAGEGVMLLSVEF